LAWCMHERRLSQHASRPATRSGFLRPPHHGTTCAIATVCRTPPSQRRAARQARRRVDTRHCGRCAGDQREDTACGGTTAHARTCRVPQAQANWLAVHHHRRGVVVEHCGCDTTTPRKHPKAKSHTKQARRAAPQRREPQPLRQDKHEQRQQARCDQTTADRSRHSGRPHTPRRKNVAGGHTQGGGRRCTLTGRDVLPRKCVRCVRHEQARLAHGAVADAHGLYVHHPCAPGVCTSRAQHTAQRSAHSTTRRDAPPPQHSDSDGPRKTTLRQARTARAIPVK
jgi:hypothetical protein